MAEADIRPLPPVRNLPPNGVHDIKSLSQIAAGYFSGYGYHTEFTEGSEPWAWQRFALFGYFKNGKLKKTPAFSISWEKSIGDSVVQRDGSIALENIRERARPYTVGGKGVAGTTRARFDDAYDTLINAISASANGR